MIIFNCCFKQFTETKVEAMDIYDYMNKKYKLKFNGKDNFRILCISDIHGGKGYDEKNTLRYISDILNKSKPDLVLLLGDTAGPGHIHIENSAQLREMLDGLISPFEKAEIPWAHVFGNHDDNYGLDNKDAALIYESYPHCLSWHTPYLSGNSDYIIPIYDDDGKKMIFNIYAFDSLSENDGLKKLCGMADDAPIRLKNFGGIDAGERGTDINQVLWYYQTSLDIEKANGAKVPSLAVMHVPVQEFGWASVNKEETSFEGYQGEPVSCQCLNSGLFRAFTERGDVKAMCFGHDHENICTAEYCGIKLSYDGYLSCHASHTKETLGGRIFDINKNNAADIYTEFINIGQ